MAAVTRAGELTQGEGVDHAGQTDGPAANTTVRRASIESHMRAVGRAGPRVALGILKRDSLTVTIYRAPRIA
jgi:hypothetical protein